MPFIICKFHYIESVSRRLVFPHLWSELVLISVVTKACTVKCKEGIGSNSKLFHIKVNLHILNDYIKFTDQHIASELQMRGVIKDDSKIIFLLSQQKYML